VAEALEDAAALGTSFAGTNDVSSALHKYQTLRIARANAILVQSRRVGQIGQWTHPLACAMRNQLVKWSAPLQMRQMDHVIGRPVTTAT
jgi:2-polyprenyl-6-methoxyphenol hydroxylase-like FAD-dependent oxidoreductase